MSSTLHTKQKTNRTRNGLYLPVSSKTNSRFIFHSEVPSLISASVSFVCFMFFWGKLNSSPTGSKFFWYEKKILDVSWLRWIRLYLGHLYSLYIITIATDPSLNPNSLDNKGSCWILKDFYCSVTMLRELGLIIFFFHFVFQSNNICGWNCGELICI